ncbi:hypothetical protein EJ02DRAFT_304405, partial [Clathrospora elynae]
MSPMEAAIAAIKLLEPGEPFTYTAIAHAHGVNRVTLAQRHKHSQVSCEARAIKQQKLDPQQELELVQYIEGLTRRALPPTREMIQNFASQVAKEPVGEGWETCFINRNSKHLI